MYMLSKEEIKKEEMCKQDVALTRPDANLSINQKAVRVQKSTIKHTGISHISLFV